MKTINLVLGIVIGIVIIIGIIIFVKRPTTTETTTTTVTLPVVTTTTNGNPITTTTTTQPTATSPSESNAGIPVVFTNPNAVVTETTANVKGAVTPTGSFTNYWYEYGTTVNLGNKTSAQMAGSGYNALGAPGYITRLTANTTYYYRLVAENQYGKVVGATHSLKTVRGVAAPTGSTPTVRTLSTSKITGTSASLNGDINPNRSQSDYWFEYGTTTNLGRVTQFLPVGNGSSSIPVSISATDLTAGTTYYYRINAQNAFGTTNGSIVNFKTTGTTTATSSAPIATTIGASVVTATTARLTGVVNPNNAETTYWFEYRKTSGLFKKTVETQHIVASAGINPLTVNADITNLSSGTTYYAQLIAKNNSGTTTGEKISFTTE